MLLDESNDVFRHQGARSYQAHVAFEHIEKLGKLVQPSLSHPAAESRRATTAGIRLKRHAAQLPYPIETAILPCSGLVEENRSSIHHPYSHREHRRHEEKERSRSQDQPEIKEPFGSHRLLSMPCYEGGLAG